MSDETFEALMETLPAEVKEHLNGLGFQSKQEVADSVAPEYLQGEGGK